MSENFQVRRTLDFLPLESFNKGAATEIRIEQVQMPPGFAPTMTIVAIGVVMTAWVLSSWLDPGASFPLAGSDCTGNKMIVAGTARIFNDSVLALHDGAFLIDGLRRTPLLLVVLGEVYDVSLGAKFYGRANASAVFGEDSIGYNIFVGRDSSRSFASGDFVMPRSDLDELTPSQVESVVGWRSFYQKHKTYRFVGVHAGLYFNCQGERTDYLAQVEAIAAYAQDAAKAEETMLAQFPICDSLYRPAEKLSTVACSSGGAGTLRVPRRLFWRSRTSTAPQITTSKDDMRQREGDEQQRCVCITLEEERELQGQPPVSAGGLRTERFDGCDEAAITCRQEVKR
jgi:hypothetical protein